MTGGTFSALAEGFALGGGLIVAIGPQNAMVLRLGLKRSHVFAAALFCSLSDVVLQAIGAAGVGSAMAASPVLFNGASLFGAVFLTVYGAMAAKRALAPQVLQASGESGPSLAAVIGLLAGLTFLNPHVYLDTVVLAGSISGHYAAAQRVWFVAGAGLASVLWFFGLGYGARLLAPLFAKPQAWAVLDGIIALVMWTIAAGLMHGVWQSLNG